MKKNTKDFISEKYNSIYKQCILKYFAFIKFSESQADFFKMLAMYCSRLVQNSKSYRMRRWSCFNQVNIEKLQQDFLDDSNKVIWRKNLIDTAFLYGYDRLVTDKMTGQTKENKLDRPQDVLTFEKLIAFLFEIEQIIRKNDDFETLSDKLKSLFQRYELSFIGS